MPKEPPPRLQGLGHTVTVKAATAANSDDASRSAVFAYEKAVVMSGGVPSQGRRVGMYLFDSTAANLTREGWTLFDAAVSWAASAP